MKLTVIGGGGVRSIFLARSIAMQAEKLGIDELVFMDTDPEKLAVFGGMAKHCAQLLCPEMSFTLTGDAAQAVTDADYVITTIRAGGDDMRCKDERIALSHGVLGQETTGAAGFSFAMRSIPALAEYCELVKKLAKKDVKVFNFTNPAGVVSQTLSDMGYDFTYGICDAPSGMLHSFASLYGADPDSVRGEVYGLNHLSYFKSVTVNGREVLDELIEDDRAYAQTDMRYFEKELLRDRKAILNEYLYYFYYRELAVENILEAEKTRGELIAEVNKKMLAELGGLDPEKDFDKCLAIFEHWYGVRENNYMASETGIKRQKPWSFDIYAKDSGGYAGVALKFIETALSGKKDTMILCTRNNGAISGLLDSDVVEITCDIDAHGATPHYFGEVDEQNLELIRRVKIYERLASEAIRKKSRSAAISCLTLHPLVNSYSLGKSLADVYIEHNRAYTDGWK